MTLKKHVLQPLFLVAAFFAVAQLAFSAQAMAVYNDTATTAYMRFYCGFFCENDWAVDPNTSKSRPNEAGDLLLWTQPTNTGADFAFTNGCAVEVDQHGWVVLVSTSSTNIAVTSYHQDGSVRESCHFDPTVAHPS